MFDNRTLVIATRHGKERVIAPILEGALGVRCTTCDTLDTDLLGTFTGEVERTLDPVATAREKCARAMRETGCDLSVASEGSFAPHPVLGVVPADDEILLLADRREGIEIVARELSLSTNFASDTVSEEAALLAFAERAGFPGHALILRRDRDSREAIHKGIRDRDDLLTVFRKLRGRYGRVSVETDMRAMHNPTRMAVIEAAARCLVERLQSLCPGCAMPGFSVTEVVRGLPCELCGLPTRAASRHICECGYCGYRSDVRNPAGKSAEDPMYCDFCNP